MVVCYTQDLELCAMATLGNEEYRVALPIASYPALAP
jgi:hypothetical protein